MSANADRITQWTATLDRRCRERYDVNLPVTATPVDDDMQPVGDSFDAVTRDISSRGIALFGHRKLDNGYLTVQVMDFDGQTHLDAVIEVLRCQPIGDSYLFAGRFVSKRYFADQSPMVE